ncbi:MAG: TRAP transporter substrate-binding protein DctP [Dehalococcoidales bacterium]|nr:TRAP transporter substrate-binding protein DctP [Dehalococcoidales bacterium]
MKGKYFKLITSICLVVVLVGAVLLSAFQPKPAPTTPGVTTPAATVYNWRLQSHVAPGIENGFLREEAAMIEEMSGGRVVITVFDGGALVAPEDEFTACQQGVIEFARASGTYYKGFVPEGDIEGGIPLMWRNMHDVETIFYDRGFGDLLQEAYNEKGIRIMQISASAPFCFWSKKDIGGIEGLKGLKIRSFGLYMEVMKDLGAAATFISHAETYTSLATGVVDASSTAAYAFGDLKNYEVCKHYYINKWGMPTSDVIMATKLYDSIPTDLQAILRHCFRYDMYNQDRVYVSMVNKMEANMTKDWGVTVHRMSDEDMQKVSAAALPYYDKFAVQTPRMAKMIQIVKDYMKEVGYLQ